MSADATLSGSLAASLAEAAANLQEQGKAAEAAFAANQEKLAAERAAVSDAFLRRMVEGSKPQVELPTDVQQIVNALLAQPRLVPAVQAFLTEKVGEINAALEQILGPVPAIPTETQ